MRYVLSWLIFWLSVVCAIHTTSTGAAPTGKQSSYQVGANRNLCSIFPSSGRDYLERAWKGSVSNLCVPPSKFIFRCLNLNMFLSCFYSRRSTADSRQHEEPNNAPYTIIQSAGDSFTKTRMVFSMLSEIASESEDLDQANFIEIRAIDSGGVRLPTKFHHDDVVSLIKQLYVEKQHLHRGTLEHVLNLVKPILAEEPNIVKIPPMQRVTVVGDLHGSLADLSRIFELAGWPGPGNTFVFNGDFVDRGDRGIEIIAVLFALKVIHPKNIILNRGNHEDTKICKLYGFFDEVLCKYGSRALYEMVCDVFTQLPLGCIIGNEAFVVHAGVPRTSVTIDQINCIPRRKLKTTVSAAWEESHPPGCHLWAQMPKWLMIAEDLLWSDPVDPTIDQTAKDFEATPNYFRGAGIRYGPGVVREFLKKNKLKTLVRSHQCVGKGWEEIHCGQDYSIWTVFSASNYDGVGNTASVLVFSGDGKGVPRVVTFSAAHSVIRCLGFKSRQKLVDLICMNKEALRRELLSVAKKRNDIREGEWSQALRRVLKLNIDLRHLRGELVGSPSDGSRMVNVESFLDRYKMQVILPDGNCFSLPEEDALAQYLLPKAQEVASVFNLLDKDLDGKLTLEEANAGLQLAKKKLASSYLWQGNLDVNAHEIFESCFAAGAAFLEVVQFCRGWCQVFLQPDLNYQL